VPLSEHEQRLFEQIERSLAEDPKFASAVRASDPRFHARRRVLVAAGVVIVGLALLIYGAVIKTTPVAVAGFVVMLASLGYAVQSHRRSQSPDLHVVGGTTSRRPRSRTGRRGSFLDRMEDRWRQRPEGHR
jgi:NaMN:DMB phosphoribosyltransferase